MKTGYFNSPVITPLVKASAQHAVFADGDVVFDWASFEIPRGTSKLIGASITIRQNKVLALGGAFDLVFVKDTAVSATPATLGTPNAAMSSFSRTDIIGALPGVDADVIGGAGAVSFQQTSESPGVIFEPEVNSGGNIGVDKYWVGGLANGALDLRGLVASTGTIDVSGENGTITDIDGTSPELVFAIGDILHFSDDIILGEVGAVSDTPDITFKFDGSTSTNHAVVAGNQTYVVPANIAAWRIQNGAGAAGDGANDEIIYNIFPLRITLHFSK